MPLDFFWPCLTAFLAGAINSVAGGGTLLTFPALKAVLSGWNGDDLQAEGHAETMANATSTIALFPAALSSAWAYRRELETVRTWLKVLSWPSVTGGTLGALLVILAPATFKSLVPWLILTASVLFALQPLVAKWLGHKPTDTPSAPRVGLVALAQFFVAIYGGYFGAGIGILMLASLGLMGMSNIHQMNALKVVLGAFINGMAVIVFLFNPQFVHWPLAITMMVLAIWGGYVGAKYGRLMPVKYVRYLVIAIGFGLTAFYFWRYGVWGGS